MPLRQVILSYLGTALTDRPPHEHLLLTAVLQTLLAHDALPDVVLPAALAEQPHEIRIAVALPPADNPAVPLADLWARLGSDFRVSLDLRVTAPVPTGRGVDTVRDIVRETGAHVRSMTDPSEDAAT